MQMSFTMLWCGVFIGAVASGIGMVIVLAFGDLSVTAKLIRQAVKNRKKQQEDT